MMKCIKQVLISSVVSLFLAMTAHAGIIYSTDANGNLTGATGVLIGEVEYNVEFTDGTCVKLFSGCDNKSDFLFNDFSMAYLASLALSKSVLLGTWDIFASKTRGCETGSYSCNILTPFAIDGNKVDIVRFQNNSFNDSDPIAGGAFLRTSDLTDYSGFTYAIWSLKNTKKVSEPMPLVLLMLGLTSLFLTRKMFKK